MIVWVEASACANRCQRCELGSDPPYQTFHRLEKLQQLAETLGPLVPLEDATLHADFPSNLDRSITPEGVTYLGTNGVGLAEAPDAETTFDRLRDIGYVGLYFAVHGLERQHDWFVGRSGAFQAILQASCRARQAGFQVHWETYLHRGNLTDMAPLSQLARDELGVSPHLSLRTNRHHPHLAWYETLRPSLQQVRAGVPEGLLRQRWDHPLEMLTEATWRRVWDEDSDAALFRHPFEPPEWPPTPPLDDLCIAVTRGGQVFLDPICTPPLLLGDVSAGQDELMSQLQRLEAPTCLDGTWTDHLRPEDSELLHAKGYSVRYKALSAILADASRSAPGVLDFCGHF